MWTRRSLWTPQRRQNVLGLGLQVQVDGYSERNIFEFSSTEEGTGAREAIFEGGFKFSASDARI